MAAPEKKLQDLLDAILDSTGTDAERREFAELVERHPGLVEPLIEQLRTHSLLQWQCDEINVSKLQPPDTALSCPSRADATPGLAMRTSIGSMAAVAATLLVGSAVLWWSALRPDVPSAVAEVVEETGVAWSAKTNALDQGKLVHPGRLEIESGALALRFRSGATVLFRGAASMEIESDMLVRLERGHATAQVPHWAKGFTIETADVQVIDLGTQFGVMARDDGMTDVVIFEGQVDLKPTGGEPGVQRRLNQGEAARVNSDGAIDRIVDVRGDTSGGWSTVDHAGSSHNVFRAIRDNIPPADGTKYYYYRITTAGLEDDAWAYVDGHPHQWNGLTAAGLPDLLRGADYVRTFNDYRYMHGFEIVVELAEPANLFVFFDDRVPTPDWLVAEFKDTGLDLGLDEGPWEGIPDHRTAVGGGKSIDNVFSVWRRRCDRGELVTLGAVGDTREARAMYGIAATPLERD